MTVMEELDNEADDRPVVYRLDVPPKDRTTEAIIIIITMVLLFVLGYVLIGHPGPMRRAPEVEHAHHSMKR